MLDAIEIKKLTQNVENPINSYKCCLQEITYNNRNVNEDENRNANFFHDECEKCPRIASFSHVLQLLDGDNIDNV